MVQGRILEWRVRPGDSVRRGDIVAVVDTEKAAIEVEVFEDGVVEEILVPEGSRVPVGTVLAILRGDGAAPPAPPTAPPETAAAVAAEIPPEVPPEVPPRAAPVTPSVAARPRASPAARKLAAELAVDLTSVVGSGPEGAITRADVERHQEVQLEPPPAVERPAERPPRPRISPLAEQVAADLGVDLRSVEGSGPGGVITRQDVERAAAARAAAPPPREPETRRIGGSRCGRRSPPRSAAPSARSRITISARGST